MKIKGKLSLDIQCAECGSTLEIRTVPYNIENRFQIHAELCQICLNEAVTKTMKNEE